MIPNKFRRLRPIINTTEQQTCSGVDALRPHPPAGKRPVPPPVLPKSRARCSVCGKIPSFDNPAPKRIPFLNIPDDKPKSVWTLTEESCFTHHIIRRRDGCSVCGSIPNIVTPPPKKIPFLKVTDNRWNRAWNQSVARHMGGVLPPLNPQEKPPTYHCPHVRRRVLEEERHENEDDVRTSIRKAEAEARSVKIALGDNFIVLSGWNERINKQEIELQSLEKESETFDELQCQVFQSLPPELRESFVWDPDETNPEDEQTGHPEHMMLLKTIKEELDAIAVHQKAIAGEMMSKKEKLERLRMEWKITYRKRDENFKLL
ncbi:uncharacterized protein LOC130555735 [Triplophysa rosa]|uniref:uncharacterized protein LOC130555735 n=1 Tax=Triplophysa rosa TaxID=992332 RepID=UPI002545E37B|nr:uncharacterized protein LOC130555735 [Triplophysa rosa]